MAASKKSWTEQTRKNMRSLHEEARASKLYMQALVIRQHRKAAASQYAGMRKTVRAKSGELVGQLGKLSHQYRLRPS